MKPLSQIRNPNAVVTEDKLDSAETTKLQQLVRVGFVDKEDLQRLKRALNKETTNLTRPEKDLLTGVFHKLLDHVLNNQQLFQKTKQSYGTSKSVDIKWSGTHTLPQAEDLSIDEAVDVSAEYGYQPGDYHSHVHAMLNTKGFKRIRDDHYSHEMTGKKLNLVVKDAKVWKSFHEDSPSTHDVVGEAHNFAFPVLLLLRRKSIRLFPDGKKVALYWADKMNRYFSVPSSGDAIAEDAAILEMIETTEAELEEAADVKAKPKASANKTPLTPGAKPGTAVASASGEHSSGVICALKGIVQNKERGAVKFRNGSRLTVDMLTAHAILTAYERLSNPENKVKFDKLLNKDNPSFMKAVDFAHKHYLS